MYYVLLTFITLKLTWFLCATKSEWDRSIEVDTETLLFSVGGWSLLWTTPSTIITIDIPKRGLIVARLQAWRPRRLAHQFGFDCTHQDRHDFLWPRQNGLISPLGTFVGHGKRVVLFRLVQQHYGGRANAQFQSKQ